MSESPRHKFTTEFKAEAAALVEASDGNIAPNIYRAHACEFDNSDGSFDGVGIRVGSSCSETCDKPGHKRGDKPLGGSSCRVQGSTVCGS